MLLDIEIKDPILVHNPHTGQLVNVAPLFDAMKEFDDSVVGTPFQNMQLALRQAFRIINIMGYDPDIVPLAEYRDTNHRLFLLEDMFETMDRKSP
ncbi:hypothetical protein LX87_05170 [Larkinella arboricola]|uniref:Uncharacterized protein n=1 Tax=Larkinella arboricola TaxID=643671 RepID=A0A327WNT9_LARAB|nr:hypothetical protein [Larkinella arboricola]RAJ92202.1 hypothetical protein LX87_05170 [Larkinella arboricola]